MLEFEQTMGKCIEIAEGRAEQAMATLPAIKGSKERDERKAHRGMLMDAEQAISERNQTCHG